jgi:hypothetical protein
LTCYGLVRERSADAGGRCRKRYGPCTLPAIRLHALWYSRRIGRLKRCASEGAGCPLTPPRGVTEFRGAGRADARQIGRSTRTNADENAPMWYEEGAEPRTHELPRDQVAPHDRCCVGGWESCRNGQSVRGSSAAIVKTEGVGAHRRGVVSYAARFGVLQWDDANIAPGALPRGRTAGSVPAGPEAVMVAHGAKVHVQSC